MSMAIYRLEKVELGLDDAIGPGAYVTMDADDPGATPTAIWRFDTGVRAGDVKRLAHFTETSIIDPPAEVVRRLRKAANISRCIELRRGKEAHWPVWDLPETEHLELVT